MWQVDKKNEEKESVCVCACVVVGQAWHKEGKKERGSRTSTPKRGRHEEGQENGKRRRGNEIGKTLRRKEGEEQKKRNKGWGNRTSKAKKGIEKDEVLVDTFFQCKFSYVKRVKVAWNATL